MTSPVPRPFPAFDVVLRGFDRHQVDDLIHRACATLASLTGGSVFTDDAGRPADLPAGPEPDPITSAELAAAPVDLVLRGYDRPQVKDVLSRLVELLAEAESRTTRG
jgi:phenylalanyl-tRNA synthetase beta subunit